MRIFHKVLSTILLLAAVAIFTGCQTVPVTGRSQLNLIPASEELQLGLSAFQQMKTNTPLSRDGAAISLVDRVGRRIATVATPDMPNAQWEFVVFESKEANAFCLPGGKVGVYTGILPITKDEAGLATVLGHEIAHATARHGAERMSESMLLQTGGAALSSSLSKADPKWQAVAATAYGLGAQLGRELPHSRLQESEADRIGLGYMAQAGHNPEAAVAFWQRFADFDRQQGGNATPWFLRTHPLDDQRIDQIKRWLPEAKAKYRPQ